LKLKAVPVGTAFFVAFLFAAGLVAYRCRAGFFYCGLVAFHFGLVIFSMQAWLLIVAGLGIGKCQ